MASNPRRSIAAAYSRIVGALNTAALRPKLGSVDLGDLRRTTPISRTFGFDRGEPIDRYYIERFLADNAALVRGRVLEIGDDTYTRRFGGASVTKSDVLHLTGDSPDATIVADLTHAPEIASESFDCIILTQTLHFTYFLEAEVAELRRILAPGGTLLCTVPGISQISRFDMDRWGDYWRLTSRSAAELFATSFSAGEVEVVTYGNVLAATALLYGLAVGEISTAELDVHDDDYQVIVAVRATRSARP